ncbi:MAG TPA: hypothetical protein DCE42_17220 [Myxococcales bacterium]|nr:hypothetical protein [Deltaproteobacteria bacterium]MBU49885.1 hypothetical protein [Deltaproteobacteria bacterium]HAA56510.1 hypothetical protein [Myxococcales bacterium]|tara:strand:+ start:2522 stop:2890 length:369 start_codon:yes stop_codon:yes gene_type:complete
MCLTLSGTLNWNDGQQRTFDQIIFSAQGQPVRTRASLMDCYPEEIVDRISFDYKWEENGPTYTVQLRRNGGEFSGSSHTSAGPTNEDIRCRLYRRTDQEILLLGRWIDGKDHFEWRAIIAID